jgi:glycerophosphoryl diester phosphodiesterase
MAFLTGHISILALVLLFGGSNASTAAAPRSHLDVNHKKKQLQTFRPYNIAHRGSNGELPEETSAAYLVTSFEQYWNKLPHLKI